MKPSGYTAQDVFCILIFRNVFFSWSVASPSNTLGTSKNGDRATSPSASPNLIKFKALEDSSILRTVKAKKLKSIKNLLKLCPKDFWRMKMWLNNTRDKIS